ncbi:hypothetical protein DL98DRAFT_508351 [Cadophora sp. DSE1049]|nr:hypothetical protein DL98DRAFT_508351 [Cadophora sp. DSE1049]
MINQGAAIGSFIQSLSTAWIFCCVEATGPNPNFLFPATASLMASVMYYILCTNCLSLGDHLRITAVGVVVMGGLMLFRILSVYMQRERMEKMRELEGEREGDREDGENLGAMAKTVGGGKGEKDLEAGLEFGVGALDVGIKNDMGTRGEKCVIGGI